MQAKLGTRKTMNVYLFFSNKAMKTLNRFAVSVLREILKLGESISQSKEISVETIVTALRQYPYFPSSTNHINCYGFYEPAGCNSKFMYSFAQVIASSIFLGMTFN